MNCPNCGAEIQEGISFCGNCGSAIKAAETVAPAPAPAVAPVAPVAAPAPTYEAPIQEHPTVTYQPTESGEVLSKRKFLKLPENKKIKSNISSAAIICYICAAITLAVSYAAGGINIIDPILLVVIGLFIQIRFSVIASLILLAYSIFNVIYMIIEYGKLGGYLVVIAGIYGTIYTIKAASAYKKYKKSVSAN